MKKSRNTNKKLQKKAEREEKRRRTRRSIVIIGAVIFAVVLTAVMILTMPRQIKFKNNNGVYTDPTTGVKYVCLTPFVYEPNLVHDYEVYGTMDGDNVYRIDQADHKLWLARVNSAGIVTVYSAEGVTPPDLSSFNADTLSVFEEDALIVERGKITDKETVSAVVTEYSEGVAVMKPESIIKTYNIRFYSDEYPFLVYCVKYVYAESGYYYCSHENNEYYPASDIVASIFGGEE